MNEKLAYLAGIIDGEGTIQLSNPKTRGRCQVAYVAIVNSCPKLLAECQNTISIIIGKKVRLYVKKAMTNLPMWSIMIVSKKSVHKLLSVVNPFLISKKNKGEAILRVLNMRGLDKTTQRYSEDFMSYWMYEWKSYWSPVETKREAPVMGGAIVRATQECVEADRNDWPRVI